MPDSPYLLDIPEGKVNREIYPLDEDKPSVDTILGAIRDILMEGRVIKVVLEAGKPYVYYEKEVDEDDTPRDFEIPTTIDRAVRGVEMVEYDTEGSVPQDILNMFIIIENEGYEVSHILAGSKKRLLGVLNIPKVVRTSRIYGVSIVESAEDIPEDVFILCGSPFRTAAPYDIKFAVKSNIGE